MDKAFDYESRDSGFKYWRDRFISLSLLTDNRMFLSAAWNSLEQVSIGSKSNRLIIFRAKLKFSKPD